MIQRHQSLKQGQDQTDFGGEMTLRTKKWHHMSLQFLWTFWTKARLKFTLCKAAKSPGETSKSFWSEKNRTEFGETTTSGK